MAKLAEIATVRNGLAFRGRIEPENDGDTRVLQASDLVQHPVLEAEKLVRVSLGKKSSRYQLRTDDVVFSARGQRQIAYRPNFESDDESGSELPIITASGLIMITANQKKVKPAYLQWVLNTKPVQHRISQFTEGSNITFISEKNLADVEIPLPALAEQKQIAQLIDLHDRRAQVRKAVAELDDKITQATAWSLVNE